MTALLKDKLLWVLATLLLLTAVSWAASFMLPLSTKVLGALLLVLAFVKVRLIIQHFMEAGSVDGLLRVVLEAWVVLIGGTTVFLYLYL